MSFASRALAIVMGCAVLAGCRGEQAAPPDSGISIDSGAVATATKAAAPSPEDQLRLAGFTYLRVPIRVNLEVSIVEQAGPEIGPALAQVVNRALVWWINPQTDLREGDEVEVVYQPRNAEEPLAHAVWFKSGKMQKNFEAVRYQPEGAKYARWVQSDGTELELRLIGGPIAEYEQITSLINDGRRHKGVDFKAAVGTPVTAPFDGTVIRKNWSMRGNGVSLDIQDSRSGNNAYFLHLSTIADGIKVGSRVKKGQVIAQSGNTGRSTAPHLHYQLVRGNKVLDPFRFHKTERERLAEGEVQKAQEQLARFAKLRIKPNDAVGDL